MQICTSERESAARALGTNLISRELIIYAVSFEESKGPGTVPLDYVNCL